MSFYDYVILRYLPFLSFHYALLQASAQIFYFYYFRKLVEFSLENLLEIRRVGEILL